MTTVTTLPVETRTEKIEIGEIPVSAPCIETSNKLTMPTAAQEEVRYQRVEEALDRMSKNPQRYFTIRQIFGDPKGSWQKKVLDTLVQVGVLTRTKSQRGAWTYHVVNEVGLYKYLDNEVMISNLAWPNSGTRALSDEQVAAIVQGAEPVEKEEEDPAQVVESDSETDSGEDGVDDEGAGNDPSPEEVAQLTLKWLAANAEQLSALVKNTHLSTERVKRIEKRLDAIEEDIKALKEVWTS